MDSKTAFAITLLSSTVLLATGCGTFSKEWREAANTPTDPARLTGQWIGTWQNTNNTHRDRMRAVVRRIDDHTLEAHFDAAYRKIIHFRYRTRFSGTFEGDTFVFQGSEDLGTLAGGLYRYQGRVSPTDFFSTYQSKYDSGTYTLKRPAPGH